MGSSILGEAVSKYDGAFDSPRTTGGHLLLSPIDASSTPTAKDVPAGIVYPKKEVIRYLVPIDSGEGVPFTKFKEYKDI